MLIKMQVFDLRSKPCLISDKKTHKIFIWMFIGYQAVHARDPNMPHLLAVAPRIINEFETEFVLCLFFFQMHYGSKEVNNKKQT